ncbi:hypothetical protein CBM2609_A110004 [Cupriavidus taiwanensis]|nr:hypothetical protein CBM2604_A90003 [Cupriavidus taiwanensis]SOZ23399.1 hypothetical protein CBM2609_A110004 [Cupriavidus taiwanensis]SOZ43816.1 hypothetical protein CBM2610_A110004 [Cupriavidus taiwanensis]
MAFAAVLHPLNGTFARASKSGFQACLPTVDIPSPGDSISQQCRVPAKNFFFAVLPD